MPEIEKIMNIATGDIEKLMNIAGDDIEKVMNIDYPASAVWTGTRGVHAGGQTGSSSYSDGIEYRTISSASSMTDQADLSGTRVESAAMSNGTRGVFAGGTTTGGSGYSNVMEYITVASIEDATDFGDLSVGRYGP